MQILEADDDSEIQSIQMDPWQMVLTPITSGLIKSEVQDIMDDFILEPQSYLINANNSGKRISGSHMRLKKSPTLQLFRLENDLDRIIEYDNEQSCLSQLNSVEDLKSQMPYDEDQCGANSNTFFTVWVKKTQSKEQNSKDIQMQYQTTIEASLVDYSQNIESLSKAPKLQILNKIREIQNAGEAIDDEQRNCQLKKYLQNFLLQYEVFCFEESWKQLDIPFQKSIALIKKGIEETFNKKIGSLSFEQRRIKLLKYLQKKRRRIWRKKVSYDCRKKVADGRLRIKGKFVTRQQVCQQLGLGNFQHFTAEEIKELLQKKMDEGVISTIC